MVEKILYCTSFRFLIQQYIEIPPSLQNFILKVYDNNHEASLCLYAYNAQQTNCYTDKIIPNQDWFP